MQRAANFAFTGCFIFQPKLEWSQCGWRHKYVMNGLNNKTAGRQTHREFHIFRSSFQLSRSGFQQIAGCLDKQWNNSTALHFQEQKHGYSLWKTGLKRRMSLHHILRAWRGHRLKQQQTTERWEHKNTSKIRFLAAFLSLVRKVII